LCDNESQHEERILTAIKPAFKYSAVKEQNDQRFKPLCMATAQASSKQKQLTQTRETTSEVRV
jgi:hypothetical protein